MARDFVINGESLLTVKGGAHMSGGQIGMLTQLGLATDQVRITPRYFHLDMKVDDFGPNVPAEVMFNLAEVYVNCKLVHFDIAAAAACWGEAMAGGVPSVVPGFPGPVDGFLAPAGSLMGNGLPVLSSGNHYVHLTILSPVLGLPWRFLAAYMTGPPFVLPLGNEKSMMDVSFRCIPYVPLAVVSGFTQAVLTTVVSGSPGTGGATLHTSGVLENVYSPALFKASGTQYLEISSSGVPLWDHGLDT